MTTREILHPAPPRESTRKRRVRRRGERPPGWNHVADYQSPATAARAGLTRVAGPFGLCNRQEMAGILQGLVAATRAPATVMRGRRMLIYARPLKIVER